MVYFRTEGNCAEQWDENDVMSYLNCDKPTAEKIMNDCRKANNLTGYGPIEKHIILDFINEKQRIEREREARYQADLAAVRQITALQEQVKAMKEQVKALKEQDATLQRMSESSSAEARKARTQAVIANCIAIGSLIIAVLALVLKMN